MNFRPLIFATVFAAAQVAHARENPYDVLGKTLAPFINLLAENSATEDRALSLNVRVLAASNLPPQFAGSAASAQFQYPDKLLLRAPILGEPVTLCRNGQDLWAIPGAKIEALIEQAALPKPKKKFKLADFGLPIPEQQLVFLPILFQVTEAGDEAVNGVNCRVLDVRLMPELAQSLHVEAWSARLWVRADYQPAKIDFTQPDWHGVFVFDKVTFAHALPPETWRPAPEQTDVLKLTPVRFKQLLDAAVGAAQHGK